MELNQVLLKIIIGGLLGIVGQLLRVCVGLKKMKDKQLAGTEQNISIPGSEFDSKRIWVSILIGFAAGVLGGLFAIDTSKPVNTQYATIIAIGYSGVDFIEGFISKYWNEK
jgi:hypothetical protein